MALTGAKALSMWCKQVTDGYKDVEIRNMTSSWRNGLAFCAILHHYRPDLINFDKLSKENIAENNDLAFTIAENELGIPALLDVEDMVQMEVPDKLSILTYVSQYYNYFKDKVPGEIPKTPKRHATKRSSPYKSEDSPKKRSAGDVPGISATKEVIGSTPDPNVNKGTIDRFCASCGKTVYLMERMQVEGKIFHRVCFVCALCELQLRMGTYRYIPAEEKFYCDKHYRQRTTSTSSDDSSRSKNDNQKSEQDALKNLLESLENKRRQAEQSDDAALMKHASVHERIANARKRFSTNEPMQTEQEEHGEVKERVDENKEANDLTLGTPRHRPPRPTQPPGKSPDTVPKEGADGGIQEAPHAHGVPKKPEPPSSLLSSEETKEPQGRPARPTSSPRHNLKHNSSGYESTNLKEQARGVLGGVLKKAQNDEKCTEDKGGIHIYETPFINIPREDGNAGVHDVLFENPRYRENIKIESKPVYENTGPTLLTLEDKRLQRLSEEVRHETESESNESDADFEMRSKSHSTSSDDRKKKKLVLKVKKKKKVKCNEAERGVLENTEKELGSENVLPIKDDQINNENVGKNSPDRIDEDLPINHDSHDYQRSDAEDENISRDEEMKELLVGPGKEASKRDDAEGSMESAAQSKTEEDEVDVKTFNHVEEMDPISDGRESEPTPSLDMGKSNEDVGEKIASGEGEPGEEYVVDKAEVNDKESFMDKDDIESNQGSIDKPVEGTVVDKDLLEEPQPYESHGAGERKRKVLKYVNPFEDSDEEVVRDDKQVLGQERRKIVLNPFQDSSDTECDSKEDIRDEELPENKEDDVIGRAVSRKIKLVAGDGPKAQVPPEKVAEHEKIIEGLKKCKNGSKEKLYRNPFEDSDDDVLEKDEAEEGKSRDDEKGHKKVLVLKVKKRKNRAPPPPVDQHVREKSEEKDTKVLGIAGGDSAPVNPLLEPPDPLETFKTYLDNTEVEVRKRMESRGGEINAQRRPLSPLSASCPALDRNDVTLQGTSEQDLSKASTSMYLTEDGTEGECLEGKGDGERVPLDGSNGEIERSEESKDAEKEQFPGKKEKPPKRPAPPVPKGVTPYKESPPLPHRSALASRIQNAEASKTEMVQEGNQLNDKSKGEILKTSKDLEGKDAKDISKKKEKDAKEVEKKKGKNAKEIVKQKNAKEIVKQKEKDAKEVGKGKGTDTKVVEKQKEKKLKENEKKGKNEDEKKKEKDKKKKAKKGEKNGLPEKQSKEMEVEEERLERTYTFIEEKPLTIDDIGMELKEIEAKQRVLEGKGVEMEKRLRDQLHGEPEEDYMVTWFDLVTEKNRLLRRENELIYMSQEIDYHDYQKKIELELRHLMEKDESKKTDEDRQAEEQLLQQLVNYVSRRNKIVEKMEKDRLREREEDEQIQMIMQAQGLRKQKKKKAGKKNSTGSVFYS